MYSVSSFHLLYVSGTKRSLPGFATLTVSFGNNLKSTSKERIKLSSVHATKNLVDFQKNEAVPRILTWNVD